VFFLLLKIAHSTVKREGAKERERKTERERERERSDLSAEQKEILRVMSLNNTSRRRDAVGAGGVKDTEDTGAASDGKR